MSLFWFAIAAMTAVALFFMLAPLVIRGRSHVLGRADFDITVYKDQLIEVDRDLERGLLNNEQAISARTEIERRMLAAMDDAEAAREAEAQKGGTPEVIKEDLAEAREEPRRRPMTSALMVAMLVLVPLGAVGLYVYLGQPKMEDLPLASRERDLNKATEGRAQLVKMISDLEQKIQANPEDPNGWALLGRSYMAMSRPGEAINAYKNLVTLTDRNPEALILMAEAMVTAERGVVTVPALDAFKEVKAADPGDPRAYFYIGLERQQKNDATGAIHEWVALLEHSPSNAQWVAEVRARIEAVATEASVSVPKFTMLRRSKQRNSLLPVRRGRRRNKCVTPSKCPATSSRR